ncbi:hypothetical protein KY335_02870 [Candidatus Woesearchaeota archaeon]|nr:hypothetical protein [Candidatus Woesearchaeota archaeon]
MGIFNTAKKYLGYAAGALALATGFSATAMAEDDISDIVDEVFEAKEAAKEKSVPETTSAPEVDVPKPKREYKLGLELDEEFTVNAEDQYLSTTRLEFYRKKGMREDLLRVDITEDEASDTTRGRIGLKIPVPLEDVVGTVSIFGTFDENDNYGIGINIHSIIKNEIIIGAEAEANSTTSDVDTLLGVFIGYKKGDTEGKIGLAKRLGESYLHGSFFTDLGQIEGAEKLGSFYIGLGFTLSESNSQFVPCFGMTPTKRGEGVGFRTFGIFKEGMTVLDLQFTFNSTLSKYAIMWLPDIHGKCLCDSSIVDNIMDYFTPAPFLHEYTTTLGINARAINTPAANIYSFELAIYPANALRELAEKEKRERVPVIDSFFIGPSVKFTKYIADGADTEFRCKFGTEIEGFRFHLELIRNPAGDLEYSAFLTKAFDF